MVNYICSICDYKTTHKGHFLRHLTNKLCSLENDDLFRQMCLTYDIPFENIKMNKHNLTRKKQSIKTYDDQLLRVQKQLDEKMDIIESFEIQMNHKIESIISECDQKLKSLHELHETRFNKLNNECISCLDFQKKKDMQSWKILYFKISVRSLIKKLNEIEKELVIRTKSYDDLRYDYNDPNTLYKLNTYDDLENKLVSQNKSLELSIMNVESLREELAASQIKQSDFDKSKESICISEKKNLELNIKNTTLEHDIKKLQNTFNQMKDEFLTLKYNVIIKCPEIMTSKWNKEFLEITPS
jgi:hypothetical protein